MSDKVEIVVVRRLDPEDEVQKGGVWKIAHADFMTAMMAFFLIMWLVNQTDQETKQSVANYFNPVNLSQSAIEYKGLEEAKANTKTSHVKEASEGTESGGSAHYARKPRFKEGALFQDPYAILARIAAETDIAPHDALGADLVTGENEVPGMPSGDVNRDPYDPLYWQVSPMKEVRSDGSVKPGSIPPAARGHMDVKGEHKPAVAGGAPKDTVAGLDGKLPETADLGQLKAEVGAAVGASGAGVGAPLVEVKKVDGGTLISLTDTLGFSMFAIGSAEPDPKIVKAMASIGKSLAGRKGQVVVRGHTDGRPFRSENYDNWRLSQARAQMALYMLVRGGLPEGRIVRVEGHADRSLVNGQDPNADVNRRIEILIQE